jgi:hypothetical protein
MDDNTEERGDQPAALATSDSFNDPSNAVPQQTASSGDDVAQQQCTSPPSSTAVTQLAHSGGSNMSFLDLPPEIRNMIYCCVFPKGRAAVQLLARHSGKGYITMSDRLHLLYTCRQIYDGATSLLQAARRFKVVQPRSLQNIVNECWSVDCHCYCCCNYTDDTILGRVLPKEGFFFDYDMDRGTVNKNLPALYYINHEFRSLCVAFASHVRFTAQTSTSTTGPVSDRFGALRCWLRQGPVHLFSLKERFGNVEISVILNFKMSAITNLEDIRFEMNSLSDAILRQPPLREELTADLTVRIENPDKSVWSNKRLVVDVLIDSLTFLRKARSKYPELRDERCPKIMIDGLFRIREARFCLRDGNMLELTNEVESFGDSGDSDDWEDMDFEERWDRMTVGVVGSGLQFPEPGQSWPLPTFETINNQTFEGITIELEKRVLNCFMPL